jgi:hypothetical protein
MSSTNAHDILHFLVKLGNGRGREETGITPTGLFALPFFRSDRLKLLEW